MEIVRYHFDTIDSTNSWAMRHAHEMDKGRITLVTADAQTAGRGRFHRLWVSPPNQNIYATFCFFWDSERSDLGNLPQVLALSAVKVLERLNFRPQLKWPNDILLVGKKVAGILCETTPVANEQCVVLGIGLNVNMPMEMLERIDRPATSLMVERDDTFEVETILMDLQNTFQGDLSLFLEQGFPPFLPFYKEKMIMLHGQEIRFHDNQKIVEGTFEKINDDGSLALKLNTGEIEKFIAGEIV